VDIALLQLLIFPNEDAYNPHSCICFTSKKHMVAFAETFFTDLMVILAAHLHHTPHHRSPTHHTLHALLSYSPPNE